MTKETFYLDEDIFGDFSNDDDYIKFWDKLENDTIDMAHCILEYPIDQQMAMIMRLLQDLATHYKRDVTEMKWLLNQVSHKVIRSRDWCEKEAANAR